MVDNKYLELIHGELDGANSPQESAALTAYLAAHPEAQRLYEELRGMSDLLSEVNPVTPPAHLQHTIMHAVSHRHASRVEQQEHFAGFKNWLTGIFEPKFALSFAGGLALGVMLFALALQTRSGEGVNDAAKLYGTIGAQQAEKQAVEIKSQSLHHELANGEIKWYHERGLLETEIRLAATEPFDLVVTFDPNQLHCKGINSMNGADLPEAILQAGRLQLSHSGEKGYRLTFQSSNSAAPVVHVQFQKGGAQLYNKEISFDTH